MIRFSIIVPVWNAEATLCRCLESLIRQSVERDQYEIIVIDDGSVDGSARIARQFSDIYHYQENQGPAVARNKGVSLAQGSVVFFTDSDCVADFSWLQEMSAPFSRLEVTAVKGAYRSEQKETVARFAQLEFEERFAMLAGKDSIDMIDTYSAGFRKDIFQLLGGFDSRFPAANNEDTELSYRMAEQGYTMIFNPVAVVCHLRHPDSIARYCRLKFSRGYWRMLVYRMYPGKMLKDSYTPQSLKIQIVSLFAAGISLLTYPFFASWALIAASCFLLFFLLLTVPFTLIALNKDRKLICAVPVLLALRAASIGCGVVWGLIRMRIGSSVFEEYSKTIQTSKTTK